MSAEYRFPLDQSQRGEDIAALLGLVAEGLENYLVEQRQSDDESVILLYGQEDAEEYLMSVSVDPNEMYHDVQVEGCSTHSDSDFLDYDTLRTVEDRVNGALSRYRM